MAELFTKYAYFWGSIGGLGVFAVIYNARKDLRRRMLRMGIAVGLVGILSEGVFFRDYWHPPLLFHIGRFGGIEDFFFGIFFGGVCVAMYDVVFHKRLRRKGYPHYWIVSLLIVSELLSVGILTQYMNSIYASAIGFVVPAIAIVLWRKDLIMETVFSALLGGSLLTFMEMLALLLIPNYLKNYFFLYEKVPMFLGIVPLTEFMWGAAFAAIVGPLRDFEFGYAPVHISRRRVTANNKK
jgi:hypothetical protein